MSRGTKTVVAEVFKVPTMVKDAHKIPKKRLPFPFIERAAERLHE